MQFNLFDDLPHNKDTIYKTCNSCGETKPEQEFYIQYHRKDGSPTRGNVCTSCKSEQSKLRSSLRKKVGSPPLNCDCCGATAELMIDHCHDSLEFRGWLCHKCNVGIGLLGDSVSGLEKATHYLKRHYDGQP